MAPISRAAFDALYTALAALAKRPDADDRATTLQRAFKSKSSHLVARAAPLVRVEELRALLPLMLAAYDYLFDDAQKRDPGCQGKRALADALDLLDTDSEAPFRRGFVYRQPEGPIPQSDTADGLRSRCGLALVRLRVDDALDRLADMLCDDEAAVRVAGATGVAYHGDARGTALLRLKLHCGDPEPDVVTGVLTAYMKLDPEIGLREARSRLRGGRRTDRESAAYALGEARCEGALAALVEYLQGATEEGDARAAIASLLMLRPGESHGYLSEYGASALAPFAGLAQEALARFERALKGEL